MISEIKSMKIINKETGEVIMELDHPRLRIEDEDGVHFYNQLAVGIHGVKIDVDEERPKE